MRMTTKSHQPTVIQKSATPICPSSGSTVSSVTRLGAEVAGQTGCPAYGFGGTGGAGGCGEGHDGSAVGSSRVGSKTGMACVGAAAAGVVGPAAPAPGSRGTLGTGTVNCSSGPVGPVDPPDTGVSLMATTYLATRRPGGIVSARMAGWTTRASVGDVRPRVSAPARQRGPVRRRPAGGPRAGAPRSGRWSVHLRDRVTT